MVAQEKKSGNESEFLTRLRSKRAMIAKKSISKISIARRLLKSDFEIGDRWLIYCADQEQLRQVRNTIMDLNITILEFHQQMVGGRVENIDLFSREGGVMLAIKCLDEGIDIPLINKALILASSANPREYIQRSGGYAPTALHILLVALAKSPMPPQQWGGRLALPILFCHPVRSDGGRELQRDRDDDSKQSGQFDLVQWWSWVSHATTTNRLISNEQFM
jgi:hypothetical protein